MNLYREYTDEMQQEKSQEKNTLRQINIEKLNIIENIRFCVFSKRNYVKKQASKTKQNNTSKSKQRISNPSLFILYR
jgi:protein subunit release factor B